MAKKGKKQHVLVIRLSAMGDVAMLVPVLSNLVKSNPSLKVTLLTRAHFAPIFSSFSNVKIVEADVKGKHKGFFGLLMLYKELRQLKITSVADVHNVLRSNILKFFFKTAGIPVAQIDKARREKKALTRAKNKDFKQLKTTHQRYADVFGKLGFPINLNEAKFIDKQKLNDKTIAVTGLKNQKWIGIAPFAAHKGKMYPLHLMEEVIAKLSGVEEYKILLFGGGSKEVKILDNIENQYKNDVISMAGNLSFVEELSIISNLDVMLSMDSGNGHLAANYGIPVITLWGVTHPYAGFAPFGQPKENALLADRKKHPLIPTSIYGNKFHEGYEDVITSILPEYIINQIKKVLK
ncbi:glycosyltransferase family 9 protein [Croceitalea sp. MTPC9]|uniref:glycosyltransferase family 9 protein n=1 Tax=unclassified Croceitalea TaxID=2632280 RepID=UPI002B39DD4E|nr:glycosyltransferase family 9 protein [Croceitalea sp. MTPC6]GMN16575.1 glycosyltransferase family 9 protein [Croceitalea sp. MTPC9]